MKYKKGDILICSTNELYGQKYNLTIGDKYRVNDAIEMSDDRIVLELIHDSTNRPVGIHSDRLFIPLWVYREFKLRKILD
jgi:hypothetical protein